MKPFLLAVLGLILVAGIAANPVPEEEIEEFESGEDYDDEAPRLFGSLASFSFKQLVKEGAKQIGKESIKQAGKLAFKEGIKQGAKQAGKLLITAGKQLTKQSLRVIKSGAIKVAKSQVVKQGKRFVIKIGKEAIKEAAEVGTNLAIQAAVDAISSSGQQGEQEGNNGDQEIDVMDYLAHADLCTCTSNQLCSCCAEIGDYPKGCVNIRLEDSLWTKKSVVRIQGIYDDTKIFGNKFPVDGSKRKCVTLDLQSGDKFTFCVSSFGRMKEGNNQEQCFDLELNGQTIRKCIQQSKDGKLSMKVD